MALPNPKDRRPAPKRSGRTPAGPETPTEPPPLSARARRKQAEEAARQRVGRAAAPRPGDAAARTPGPKAERNAERSAERKAERQARRRAGRDARTAKRAEQNARRVVRLRRILAWVFPDHTRRVPRGKAIAILLLNIFPFPGLGTALYGHWERGLLQFLLTFLFLIGWVWAVFDGIRIVSAAYRPPPALRQPTRRPTR